jgi:hypothetical protein
LQLKRPEMLMVDSTPIDADCLSHINFTAIGSDGNMGLLRNDRMLWPVWMRRANFASDREQIDQMLARIKTQAATSRGQAPIDANTLLELGERVKSCQKRLRNELKYVFQDPELNDLRYCEADKFVNQLRNALITLDKPEWAFYLAPIQGQTVAEVVAYMKSKGLRFAAATCGCERFYSVLHRALADEVTRLQQK